MSTILYQTKVCHFSWFKRKTFDDADGNVSSVLKKLSKTGDRFTATSDLQNNMERALFQAGNRQLSQKFPAKAYSPQVPMNWE